MQERDARAKQPVSAVLTGPYGHPFHPILVTVPIGAWVSSLVLDLASLWVSDGAALATGATWLIGIGVVGALAAAVVGLLDFVLIPTGTPAHRTALVHMGLNVAITVGFVLDLVWRLNADAAGRTPVGPIVLSVVCLLALGLSGSLGGKLSYRYGVRVVTDAEQADGFTRADAPANERLGRPSTGARGV
jgi:uncharacterized membrane protein